ncbi:MAG TPA: response regulator transcription factor [Streptosporangiaceae bacterium]|nr:response regulator transcription factor [Streptosporangiaceae bacterium]
MTMSNGGQRQIRVFLLDDHDAARRRLRELLAEQPDMEVVGEAGRVLTARQRIPELRPDVAVLDAWLPDGDGMSVCREIRAVLPGTTCLILLPHGDERALADSVLAGADGCVLKHARAGDLVDAVRTVAAGLSTLDIHAARLMIERIRMPGPDPLAGLTGQERRVLCLVGAGLMNRQIAERMSLSELTVRNYVASLLAKLGMHRRAQAAAFVARRGLARRRDHSA